MRLLSLVCLLLSFSGFLQDRRIIEGEEVKSIVGYEHQVSIRIHPEERFGSNHICGGSLIESEAYPNSSVVLTAAHCVHDPELHLQFLADTLVVSAGGLNKNVQDSNTLYIQVAKIISHKDYDFDIHTNDIAMLILAEKIPADHPTAKPIKIGEAVPGQVCQASGWGRTESVS